MNTDGHELNSFLRKLLDGAEVEWKALGEVANVLRGKRLTKKELSDDNSFPVYHGGLDPMGFYHESNRSAKTVMLINVGASAGTVGFSDKEFWSSDGCFAIDYSDLLNSKFLYYLLIGHQQLLRSRVRVAGIPTLDSIVVEKLQIPIPCPEDPKRSLEIQSEIVRILDTFTELTTELTNRKKQYNHYRDQLLSFEDGEVEWKTLGEVCGFKNGFAFKSSLFRDIGCPIIRITNIDGKNVTLNDVKYFDSSDYKEEMNSFIVDSGDILVAMSGATTGKIGFYSEKRVAYINQRVGKFIPKPKSLNNRYLYHNLLSRSQEMLIMAGGGAQPNLSSNALMDKLRIPIPYPKDPERSLAAQARIAAILDKFDTMTHSISEGLPREIELRQKQYEYYRNLLLNFPKPKPQTEVGT